MSGKPKGQQRRAQTPDIIKFWNYLIPNHLPLDFLVCEMINECVTYGQNYPSPTPLSAYGSSDADCTPHSRKEYVTRN